LEATHHAGQAIATAAKRDLKMDVSLWDAD
jgi:hypothetical protein